MTLKHLSHTCAHTLLSGQVLGVLMWPFFKPPTFLCTSDFSQELMDPSSSLCKTNRIRLWCLYAAVHWKVVSNSRCLSHIIVALIVTFKLTEKVLLIKEIRDVYLQYLFFLICPAPITPSVQSPSLISVQGLEDSHLALPRCVALLGGWITDCIIFKIGFKWKTVLGIHAKW